MSRFFDLLRKDARTSRFSAAVKEVRVQARPVPIPISKTSLRRGNGTLVGPYRNVNLNVNGNSRLVFLTEPAGLAAEQYRLLRRRMTSRFPQGAMLLVTSPTPGDGKTLNAINLAWCLAEGDGPTLLLEADLRQPTVAKVLGCSPLDGVEAALLGEAEPETVVWTVSGSPLCVAMAAKGQSQPARILKDPRLRKFMGWAKNKFRWTVVDAPPVFPAADVAELCPLVDAALLIVRARKTPQDLVLKSFEVLGDRLTGVILNEATLCLDSHYRYLDHDYYYGRPGRK